VKRNSQKGEEGEAFNEILGNKSKNEVKSKRRFKKVEKTIASGSSDEFKIININVEEQPTGEIFAGAGTGTSGSSVSFGIKRNNYLGKGYKS
jgi:Outer membrane protein/protective antigen OMA87